MKTSLAGKVALVVGVTRGAGLGIPLQLGAAGAAVYVTEVQDAGKLADVTGSS